MSAEKPRVPHPDDIASREALAKLPPVTLESVRRQVKASEEWRRRHLVVPSSAIAEKIEKPLFAKGALRPNAPKS